MVSKWMLSLSWAGVFNLGSGLKRFFLLDYLKFNNSNQTQKPVSTLSKTEIEDFQRFFSIQPFLSMLSLVFSAFVICCLIATIVSPMLDPTLFGPMKIFESIFYVGYYVWLLYGVSEPFYFPKSDKYYKKVDSYQGENY